MKKCACCGKTGLFLELNRDGACRQCAIDQKHVLNESLEKTVERLATLRTSEMEKVRVSLNAQQRINERSRRNFEEIFRQYQKATQLEKGGQIDKALAIYLSLIPKRPEGTLYYSRPCIILEKKKEYEQAIEICDIAIEEIRAGHFNADAEEFVHRKDRLVRKLFKP